MTRRALPRGTLSAMSPERELLELASESLGVEDFRTRVSQHFREWLDADVALLATLEPWGHAPAGFEPATAAALEAHWDAYGRELAPVRASAARHGSSSDREVLGCALERTRVYREVMAPSGGHESLLALPAFRNRLLGLLMVGRRRRSFSRAARGRMATLAAGVAVTLTAVLIAPPVAPPELTAAERDLLEYLQLGHSTRDIALARGRSVYTVRNQLSRLYRKLGVANRTEAVGAMGRSTHR